MTSSLPFEILTAIFEQVDDVEDLRHVRTASRTLCAAATPIAFRVLSVTSTRGSAHNLGRLFDVPEIAAYVREVAYCDARANGSKSIPLPELRSIKTSAIPELSSSFSRIHQLPRLETINLVFFEVSDEPRHDSDIECRLALQASILGALVDSFSIRVPPKLTSLFLHNLRTWDLTPLESAPFQAALKNLRRLRLSMLYDRAHDLITSLNRRVHFWGTLCHPLVLAPTQHALTELTLQSDVSVGASSGLSLTGLHFPYLCTLSLRSIVFEPSVGVESFILRHAATLVRLELITCKLIINMESDTRPIYWAHIWDSFTAELTSLVALHVSESYDDSFEPEFRYVRHGRLTSYCGMVTPDHVNVADDAARRRLYATQWRRRLAALS